jgi:hypothetical protein
MKIEIPDETYNFLVELAKEMQLQDNRCTDGPIAFIIQEKKERDCRDGCHDYYTYYDNEESSKVLGDWSEDEELWDEFADFYYKENDVNIENSDFNSYEDEFRDWLVNEKEYSEIAVKKEWVASEGPFFLTAKSAEEHIKNNGHHYSEPRTYGVHVFRNPELEELLFFVCGFAPQPYIKGNNRVDSGNNAYGPYLNKFPIIKKI